MVSKLYFVMNWLVATILLDNPRFEGHIQHPPIKSSIDNMIQYVLSARIHIKFGAFLFLLCDLHIELFYNNYHLFNLFTVL